MLKPYELSLDLAVSLDKEVPATTGQVWDVLVASRDGDLEKVKRLVDQCPALIYAQYNYTPPIHFAVREGHTELVGYLLDNGAHAPEYKTYPFSDTLSMVASDRGFDGIVELLADYAAHPERQRFEGDNGGIDYQHSDETVEFQRSIAQHRHGHVAAMLDKNPGLVLDPLIFWGEGVLCRSANDPDTEMLELLVTRGAKVPKMSKWGRAYYFKHYPIAKYLIDHGMDANHTTWHHVTMLHDMAQEGDIAKAELLLDHGAEINALEEEYCSTPIGLAARWGDTEMVEFLLKKGADPVKAAAPWATPREWARKKGHAEIERLVA
jgi:ankyrin repeat protein